MDAAFEPPEAGKGKDIYFPLGLPGGAGLCKQLDNSKTHFNPLTSRTTTHVHLVSSY